LREKSGVVFDLRHMPRINLRVNLK